jgi:hypothetical protein
MTARPNTLTRWIGLALGLCLAVALLATWRVPATGGTLGADVKLVATPPGELTLKPPGAFLAARGLMAGAHAAGRLAVRNITGRRLAVRVRMLPSNPDLDDALVVRLGDAGEPLTAGRLGGRRRWSRGTIELAPGELRSLDASVSIARRARNWEGRIVDVTVELLARPARR